MFMDRARILVASGAGGDGVVQWRREKFIPAGGPAGGNGGRGGSVWLVATDDLNTLLDFRYNRKFVAEPGEKGGIKNMHGKAANDIEVRVPVGTVVYDAKDGAVLADMSEPGMRWLAAKGGMGGRGNAEFATPTRKAPNFAEPGTPGETLELDLQLKLIADIGLVGMPNAGKSTLITAVSAARPKIADYPFTTLEPNLGVIRFGPGDNAVMADIPGLVEGASEGVGLGHEFLRHVERCRLLVHLLDTSGGFEGRDPLDDFKLINAELARYSAELAARPMVVVLNKLDLPEAQANRERVEAAVKASGFDVFGISAATHEHLQPLLNYLHEKVKTLPPPQVFEPTVRVAVEEPPEEATIAKENDVWQVRQPRIERFIANMNPEAPDAITKLHKMLDEFGVIERLREMGVNDGDTVAIGDFEFDFVD
jgi:GTP-binding protein